MILPILHYPDPQLHTVAKPVSEFNESLKIILKNMFETMYHAQGIGLAATQVNIHQRIITIDLSEERNKPQVFINPEITNKSVQQNQYQEGCLSVPGVHDYITRPKIINIKFQDIEGNFHELEADELLATCLQHEIDHLNGIVFVQHLSRLKQDRAKTKVQKLIREAKKSLS